MSQCLSGVSLTYINKKNFDGVGEPGEKGK